MSTDTEPEPLTPDGQEDHGPPAQSDSAAASTPLWVRMLPMVACVGVIVVAVLWRLLVRSGA